MLRRRALRPLWISRRLCSMESWQSSETEHSLQWTLSTIEHAAHILSSDPPLNGPELGNFFRRAAENRLILPANLTYRVNNLLTASKWQFTSSDFGNYFYGIKPYTLHHPCIENIIHELLYRFKRAKTLQVIPEHFTMAATGISNLDRHRKTTQKVLYAMITALERSCGEFSSVQLTILYYSLKNFSSDMPAIPPYLNRINKKFASSTDFLSATHASSMMYGFRRMRDGVPEVREFLAILLEKMRENNLINFTSFALTKSIYGFARMNSSTREVQNLLEYLSQQKNWEPASSQSISCAFVGLSNLSLQDPGVAEMVDNLTKQLDETPMEINARALANVMYFMRHYDDRYNGRMLVLLRVVNKRLQVCPDFFSPQEINSAMFGLRFISDAHPEVLELLVHVMRHIHAPRLHFDTYHIPALFLALSSMTSLHEPVTAYLSSIQQIFQKCGGQFSCDQLSIILSGMQNMGPAPAVLETLRTVNEKLVLVKKKHFTQKEIVEAFRGIQHLSLRQGDVYNIFYMLWQQLDKDAAAARLAAIVYMCQNWSDPIVDNIMQMTTDAIKRRENGISKYATVFCFTALKTRTIDSPKVKELLEAVIPICLQNIDEMPMHHFARILFGVRNIDLSQVANGCNFLNVLISRMNKALYTDHGVNNRRYSLTAQEIIDKLLLFQEAGRKFSYLSQSSQEELSELLMTLIVLQKKHIEKLPKPSTPSRSVMTVVESLRKQYPTSIVSWSPNELHYGWFLHDVIRVETAGQATKIYGVDLHHAQSSRMTAEYNAMLRREYLERKGVQIIQVPVSSCGDLTQTEIARLTEPIF